MFAFIRVSLLSSCYGLGGILLYSGVGNELQYHLMMRALFLLHVLFAIFAGNPAARVRRHIILLRRDDLVILLSKRESLLLVLVAVSVRTDKRGVGVARSGIDFSQYCT